MGITFDAFVNNAAFYCLQYPIMLRGRHGIGKSQVVYQLADKLGWDTKENKVVQLEIVKGKGKRRKTTKIDVADHVIPYRVVERRASQMTEGDTLGLPSPNPRRISDDIEVTTFNPPEWLGIACTEPVILFLDEIDRGTQEVRQSLFELADSRKIWGRTLHPGTLIFAAINGGEHGDNYQVQDMDPAEKDRWTVFDIDPSVEDWLTWAKSEDKSGKRRIMDIIVQYIFQNPQQLEHLKVFEPKEVYPSRRSWDRLNSALSSGDLIERLMKKDKSAFTTVHNISTGFLGFNVATHFTDFVRKYEFQVQVEEILDEGKIDKVKDFGFNDHLAMIEKMEGKGVFAKELTEKQIKNIADYFNVLPAEVAVRMSDLLMKTLGEAIAKSNDITYAAKLFSTNGNAGKSVKQYLTEITIADPEIMQRVAEQDAKKEEEKSAE